MQPYSIKPPLIVDLYQEEYPVKWAGMNPKPYRAIFQVTKGQFHEDVKCQTYIQESQALGIKYGLYHYLFPNNVREQVQLFTQRVDALGGLGHFPPVVDVEYLPPKIKKGHPDNMPRGKAWADQIKLCLDGIEAWCGEKPMLYTSWNFWQHTYDGAGHPPAWTNDYPLWVAWYPTKTYIDSRNEPRADRMPLGWAKWALWQYSQSGRSDGYLANDLNMITPEYKAELDARFP